MNWWVVAVVLGSALFVTAAFQLYSMFTERQQPNWEYHRRVERRRAGKKT